MEISTAGQQPTLTGENDIGFPNGDTYYAAIRRDTHGNAIILFDYSSPHDWPSVAVTAAVGPIVGEQGGNFISPVILAEGTASTTSRWGDYSGAAIDPTNRDVIWTAAQVADNFGDASLDAPYRWATHIDAVSVIDSTLAYLPHEATRALRTADAPARTSGSKSVQAEEAHISSTSGRPCACHAAAVATTSRLSNYPMRCEGPSRGEAGSQSRRTTVPIDTRPATGSRSMAVSATRTASAEPSELASMTGSTAFAHLNACAT
jgi:hypothetical protein